MSRVEAVEQAVQALDTEELADFRAWFAEYDWTVWDQQLERHAMTARLNKLADRAIGDRASDNAAPFEGSRATAVKQRPWIPIIPLVRGL